MGDDRPQDEERAINCEQYCAYIQPALDRRDAKIAELERENERLIYVMRKAHEASCGYTVDYDHYCQAPGLRDAIIDAARGESDA